MSGLISHVYQLHALFKRGRRLTIQDMAVRLDCSKRTVIRVKKFMATRLVAPITSDSSRHTFFYDERGDRYELPGIWLSAGELSALATLTHLAESLDPGLIRKSLGAARQRINKALRTEDIDADLLSERIRILPMQSKPLNASLFETVAEALLRTRRLTIRYATSDDSKREISPQQLVRYRDNWYLDAYCHLREGMRTFALAEITKAELNTKRCRTIGKRTILKHFTGSYGLFSGPGDHTATVHFTGPAAHYTASQQWHPEQKSRWLNSATFELCLPFGDPRELAGDLMRWGKFAKVIEPQNLRKYIANALKDAALQYNNDSLER